MASLETLPDLEPEASIDERRALIDRIAASSQFRRSARLRDFLLYVGHRSLKKNSGEIHEQEIGEKVFGRSASYDRGHDNIVRVNATELRKRIEAYFAGEGAEEQLLLAIPRGSYKPIFYRRSQAGVIDATAAAADLPPFASTEAPASIPGGRSWLVPFLAGLSLLLAILCAVLWLQMRSARQQTDLHYSKPSVAAFWKKFAGTTQEVDLVLPDGAVSISEEMTGTSMSLSDYIDHEYARPAQLQTIGPDRVADLRTIFNHNLVTLGDFHAAQQFLALKPLGPSLNLTLARFYSADSIKRNNLVLIGGKKANPWVQLFDEQLNFSVDYDTKHWQSFIANRHPRPGEQAEYLAQMSRNAFAGYSVVDYISNPGKTGNVLIIAGTDSDATAAAAEFLTSEERLKSLTETLHSKELPHFELLLKTARLSGASFNAEVLAYRTYP